ncbi:MAG: tRNA pseudouridine(38-40) synthase TruA [Clostridium sp.]|nr:tRNA pseudouridine(38-40) synthase TruA [Clostridium sp.]
MRNLKMTIQYDGSKYKGWQRQKVGDSTIEYKIENVLSKMADEKVKVIGCGRTDPGEHAENYIANFHTECQLSEQLMLDYLYEFLPEDIVVKSIEEVPERFQARYNVKSKTYVYRINNSKFRNVFNRKYVYQIDEKLNISDMKKASEILTGTHDFKSFTNLKSDTRSTVKTINYINIKEVNGILEIEINGEDFLLNMVRIIIGTLLDAASGKLKVQDVQKILDKKERTEHGSIAQAKGLCLKEVQY